jgi:hypothetical protein
MKSNKWILGLLTVALVLTLAPSSFAQIQLVIQNTPSAAEVITDHEIQTADPTSVGNGLTVSGELLASSNLASTTMTITFPGPITSTIQGYTVNGQPPIAAGIPAGDPIIMSGQSGLFAGEYITTFNGPKGTITIVLQAVVGNTQSGSFRISGVHMDPAGLTAPLVATVSLSSGANGYLAPSPNTFPIVTALPAGIASLTQSAITNPGGVLAGGAGSATNGTMLFFTNGSNPATSGTIVLTEGCAFCWRTATDVSSSGVALSNGTSIRLTVTGIPAGITLTPTAYGVTKAATKLANGFTNNALTAPTSSNAAANQTSFAITADSMTATEQIEVVFAATGNSTQTTPSTITVTATMAPVGTGLDATVTPSVVDPAILTVGYPQYTDVEVGPVTIGTVTAATTTLLVPYVVSVGGYDTGIEIANTTSDPFASTGFGATATNGSITFNLYSDNATRNGSATPLAVTTSSTKIFGQGLDSSGNLDAGSVWTGSLTSDILPAAGVTVPSTGFFGYIFITTNFLDAHGIALTYNGAGTSYGAPLLVVPPPSSGNNRSAPGGGFENLNN